MVQNSKGTDINYYGVMQMTRYFDDKKMLYFYIMVIGAFLLLPLLGNRAVTVIANTVEPNHTIVIDAGHGGIDSGAVSCTGVYESHINLEIARKLEDMMHLLGLQTVMVRSSDRSVHTQGNTIAAQKVSDIKERIRILENTSNPILVSIHQNNFSDSKYSGAQVFYNANPMSQELAAILQSNFRQNLSPNNQRKIKKSSGIYLMEHISCPGILVECGFLSNPTEEAKLRNPMYQKQICAVIGTTVSQFLNT